jgi:methionyl-tRNA synthetase
MYHLAESLRISGVLLKPFLTKTPDKIFEQLGIQEPALKEWASLSEFGQLTQVKVSKGVPIFPRLEVEEEVQYIKEQMQGTAPAAEEEKKEQKADASGEITFDEFMKVEMRVAEVIHAEPVKKADRLLKLQLDLGSEKRQVVSGIAKSYQPEQLVGKKVICITNLKPVKLRGELSQGMILAGEEEGNLSLATVDSSLPNGTIIK